MAFEAPGFGVVGAGRVASFAIPKRRNEDVAGFLAGERTGMAAHAGKSAMGIVVEARMRHPTLGEVGFRHVGQ
jgi:hypothetical protein